MGRLAMGATDLHIDGADRSDEIGDMNRAVEVFCENADARLALEADQRRDTEARLKREEPLRERIAQFRTGVGSVLEGIDGASRQMNDTAESLAGLAAQTRGGATMAASSSTQASANVQTMASAAEELSASIAEISGQLSRATEIVSKVTSRASRTTEQVAELASAARRIGEVVEMIQEIAEQTNLLALNATIEAARAGESGRGFAVVASEVKALASQTAKATKEISHQIEGIQLSTGVTVEAITEISETMNEVNMITASIAAVEEQNYSTQEISRNVQEAASGAEEVARNVESIAGAADTTARNADQVREASGQLTTRAERLNREVADFLGSVQAA
jgi:methyl-accepting chemotaxis protein